MKIIYTILFLVVLFLGINCSTKNNLRKAAPTGFPTFQLIPQTISKGDQVQGELFQLINKFRKENKKTPALKLHKGLQANAKNGLSDMIKSISHFHDHVGFENRVKDPKYELYGELLVKTSSKYDISNQMMAFILTKKEIGAELLKDYNLAGISCQSLKQEWVCSVELAKYF